MKRQFEGIYFDGQQSDERILYVIHPSGFSRFLSLIRWLLLPLFLFIIAQFVIRLFPETEFILYIVLGIFVLFVFWWNHYAFTESKTYITDRRIVRFRVMRPMGISKRMLFWSEALKAKAHSKNFFWQLMKVGTLHVQPQLAGSDEVSITDVFLYNDLSNYIDKIIFAVKNKPTEIQLIKPFVPKRKGKRD